MNQNPNPYEATNYGSNQPGGNNPNNPYEQYEPTQRAEPYQQPPYAPPPSGQGSSGSYPPPQYPPQQPGAAPNPYSYPNPPSVPPPAYNQAGTYSPTPPPPTTPRRSSTGRILIVALVILVVLAGIAAAIYIPLHNTQIANTNATATAQAQATAQVQATATALQAIFNQATSGTPVLNDPLSQQDANNWEVDNKTGGGGCAFTGGSYHASMPQAGFFASCYAQNSNFSNFAFQVQMTILKGDRGGIIFRSDSAATKFYLLRFDQNGTYNLFVYSGNSGSNAKNLLEGSAPSFHTGANRANQIAIVARGSNIYLYVNQQYLTSLTDSTYSSGSIAVFAEDHTNSTEVAFSNAQVWNL